MSCRRRYCAITANKTPVVMLVIRTYALYDRSRRILALLIVTHVGGAVACLVWRVRILVQVSSAHPISRLRWLLAKVRRVPTFLCHSHSLDATYLSRTLSTHPRRGIPLLPLTCLYIGGCVRLSQELGIRWLESHACHFRSCLRMACHAMV